MEKEYKISLIRGYANKLFAEGTIQVPLITNIESFLDSFENWVKMIEELKLKKEVRKQ